MIFLIVVIPFGAGYYIAYLYRTVNVLIAGPMSQDLGLGAAELGLLTALYFFVFAVFQTPLGILLDRYGPRKTQIFLLGFSIIGSVLFALSSDYLTLSIGRILIGLGVSGALMAALQANSIWFPLGKLPLMNGITIAFGSFGALSATLPVELLFEWIGWRNIFWVLAIITAVLIGAIWFVVPEKSNQKQIENRRFIEQIKDLKKVYKSQLFWRVSILTLVHNGVFLSYQSLWLGPWLRDVESFTTGQVGVAMFLFNFGMLVGVIMTGAFAGYLQRFDLKPLVMITIGVFIAMIIQTCFILELTSYIKALCFFYGFFGSTTMLAYAFLAGNFRGELIGKVNTAHNMLTFSGAFVAQWAIGLVISLWPLLETGGYQVLAHKTAFLCALGIELLAFLVFILPWRKLISNQR